MRRRRLDAGQRVVRWLLEFTRVDDDLVVEDEHRRLALLLALQVDVAALAQDVPEEHRALPGVHPVAHRVGCEAGYRECARHGGGERVRVCRFFCHRPLLCARGRITRRLQALPVSTCRRETRRASPESERGHSASSGVAGTATMREERATFRRASTCAAAIAQTQRNMTNSVGQPLPQLWRYSAC